MKPSIKPIAKKHDAEIILYGDIGFEITAKGVSDELKALGDRDQITVRINSFGGEVFEGVAIYSRLIDSGAKITVFIDGIAASIASVIAMAGNEIHITEGGFMMVHDASVFTAGNAADLRKKAAQLEAVSEQMAGIYQRRTGLEMVRVRELMAAEAEFNAEQSVELGFATDIFEAERLAAHYNPERHNFKKPPSVTLQPRQAAAQIAISGMEMALVR